MVKTERLNPVPKSFWFPLGHICSRENHFLVSKNFHDSTLVPSSIWFSFEGYFQVPRSMCSQPCLCLVAFVSNS